MLITLIRHAEVQKIYQERYIGHTDVELSSDGLRDSIHFSDYFIQNNQQTNYDAIYCSDLIRCKKTLAPFLKKLKTDISPCYTAILREKSWGRHEGLNYKEICQQENTLYQNFDQWLSILDGENNLDFIQRINDFKEKLIKTELNNVLIMTHGGVIHTFIYLLTQLTYEQSFYIKIPYTSFVVLNLENAVKL
jgi:alpha-ribazole phosphatase